MANILYEPVDEYLHSILLPRDKVLEEMESVAAAEKIPIVGPTVGRLLALLAETTGARKIFEMGSAIGYSTIWLARAAGPKAKVYYTDGDPKNAERAAQYIKRAGVANRVKQQVGDALV